MDTQGVAEFCCILHDVRNFVAIVKSADGSLGYLNACMLVNSLRPNELISFFIALVIFDVFLTYNY